MLHALRVLPYKLMTPIALFALRVFFRRVEVRGEDNVPAAPMVVAANHPNMLLDPLLVGMSLLPRPLHFLAKAPLFRIPVVGTIFRALGVLPVFRKQDAPEAMGGNQAMFAACIDALHAGGAIGIFPEGVSSGEPRLQPIKTGAARILLEACEARPAEPLFLQPVGLNYEDRRTFRSDVLVLFGEAIDVRPFLAQYGEDPRGAARALTDELETSLLGLTRNLARVEDERVIARLERVYQSEVFPVGDDLEKRLYLSRNIVDGFEYYRDHEPTRTREVERKLDAYFYALEALGVAGAHLRSGDEGYRFGNVLLFLVRTLPALVLATPVALYGAFFNFVPYNLTDPLSRRGETGAEAGAEEVATNKVVYGAVLFALTYMLLAAAAYVKVGGLWAALFLLSLPPTGLVGVWWVERVRYLAQNFRTFALFVTRRGFRKRMITLRRELLEDLERLSEDYLRRREGDAKGGR